MTSALASLPNSALGKLLSALGVDRAILFSILARAWSAGAGLITIWMIARRLSPAEQGFYYTFFNLAALQVVIELGLGYVLMQTASQEMGSVVWSESGVLEGDPRAKARLSSLLRGALRWYGVLSVLFAVLVGAFGGLFFAREKTQVDWIGPWILMVVASSGAMVVYPLLNFFEGLGMVAEVAGVRLVYGVVGAGMSWLALGVGLGLFATAGMSLSVIGVAAIWMGRARLGRIREVWRARQVGVEVEWKSEIWPFQWRIAISWICSYFIVQAYSPFMFWAHGAVQAGQMGTSLQVAGAVSSTAFAWVLSKAPIFGRLHAQREWVALDALFYRAFRQSLLVFGGGATVVVVVLAALEKWSPGLAGRFLPLHSVILLIGVFALQHGVFCVSVYLRASKKEPMLFLNIVTAVIFVLIMFAFGTRWGADGISAGFIGAYAALILPWAWRLMRSELRIRSVAR